LDDNAKEKEEEAVDMDAEDSSAETREAWEREQVQEREK